MNKKNFRKNDSEIRVLMFLRDPSWGGGVVNYVGTLISHISNHIKVEQFRIGQRPGSGRAISRIFTTVLDVMRLIRQLKRKSYDVVHVNPSLDGRSVVRDGIFLLILRLMKVKNSLVFIHGWSDIEASRIKNSQLRRLFFLQTFGSSALIVVLASKFKQEMLSIGCMDHKVVVSTTMFDNAIFANTQPQKTNNIKRIIFMARFVKEKGIYELMNAFHTVIDHINNCELILAGDGPEMEAVKQWINEHSMAGNITTTGYVQGTTKGQLLVNSDLFVLPTFHGEGCPVSILEAMAAGLPIISTKVGGIPDILEDGKSGILLNDNSTSSISTAIIKLLSNEELLNTFGDYNKNKAINNYEANIVSGSIEALYKTLSSNV